MTTIEFDKVGFGYTKDSPVISDICFTITKPGLYCILGPNGVGKSTLVKCLCKIVEPTSGRVLIDGRDVAEMTYKEVSTHIGFVPASTNDVFSMSVVDTVLIGRHNKKRWGSAKEDLKLVYKALKLLHIENLAEKNFNQLSAGQHQKVALARGIVQDPEILILDEPTSNLDVKFQVYVAELLKALAEAKGMIVIMISHDLNITAKYADEIVLMNRPGVIHSVGKPEDIIVEENISEVYDIGCRVVKDERLDVPLVVLGEALMNRED